MSTVVRPVLTALGRFSSRETRLYLLADGEGSNAREPDRRKAGGWEVALTTRSGVGVQGIQLLPASLPWETASLARSSKALRRFGGAARIIRLVHCKRSAQAGMAVFPKVGVTVDEGHLANDVLVELVERSE